MLNFGEVLLYISIFFGIYSGLFLILTYFEQRSVSRGKSTLLPHVTIAVPCYNEENTVEKTIKSLSALDYPKNKLQIIAVNDGSRDNTLAILYKLKKKYGIDVIDKKNGGKYTANNAALKVAKGELFGTLDADSWVDKKALRNLVKHFDTPNTVAVTPAMKIANPKNWLQHIQYVEYLMGVFLRKVFAMLGSIHVTPGPFTVFRKSFFEKHGAYRHAYLTEDIEIALRVQSKNGVIDNAQDASVYTIGPDNFKELYLQRIRWYTGFIRNVWDYRFLFGKKHGNLGLFILPSSIIFVGLIIAYWAYFIISNTIDWISRIQAYHLINYDIFRYNLFIDTFYVYMTDSILLTIAAAILSLIALLVAKKMAGDTQKIRYSYILYVFLYWMLFSFWWGVSLIKVLTKRKTSWAHKSDV